MFATGYGETKQNRDDKFIYMFFMVCRLKFCNLIGITQGVNDSIRHFQVGSGDIDDMSVFQGVNKEIFRADVGDVHVGAFCPVNSQIVSE